MDVNDCSASCAQSLRALRDFGLDSAQRRTFFEGRQVIFEDPATSSYNTATIFQLEQNTLRAGLRRSDRRYADLLPHFDTLSARSRDLGRKNGLMAGGMQTMRDNIVGAVLRLSEAPRSVPF